MSPPNTVFISSIDPFLHGLEGVTYLGLEWVLNPIVRTDISVPELLKSVGGDFYAERRDQLVRILDIDLRWRYGKITSMFGECQRVHVSS